MDAKDVYKETGEKLKQKFKDDLNNAKKSAVSLVQKATKLLGKLNICATCAPT